MHTKSDAVVAQLVEHQLPKLRAAGSNPVFRSKKRMICIIRFFCIRADVASLLAKGGTGYKKRGCVSIPSFFESAPAASGKGMAEPQSHQRGGNAGGQIPQMRGMRSPQGEHNPAGSEGMAEHNPASIHRQLPRNNFPLKISINIAGTLEIQPSFWI